MNKVIFGALILCFGALTLGCGGVDISDEIDKVNDSKIKRMMAAYRAYQAENKDVGPPDEATFKEFLKSDKAKARLSRLNIDASQADDLFISGRDGQAFKIRYGIVTPRGRGNDEPFIFESTGVDGTWQVGFTSHQVRETSDQEEYDAWMEGDYEPQESPEIDERKDTYKQ